MSSSIQKKFVRNDTRDGVTRYVDEICSDPDFLCSNRDLCGSSTTIYSSRNNVEQICKDRRKANVCDTNFNECLVNVKNLFEDSHALVSTSFVNIIIPITNAFDKNANQKFLRLPSLGSSKKPKSQEICNICACMNRFSTSPGASNVIDDTSYTSPGQDTCIYPEFIEHFYYPLDFENINNKLKDKAPPVRLGKYNVVNSNIIYAHSEEDLTVQNLYDLLIRNDISEPVAKNFILNVLYQSSPAKSKDLDLYISKKTDNNKRFIKNGIFYENITFFYIIFMLFVSVIILKFI
jgi:hypothetical protein